MIVERTLEATDLAYAAGIIDGEGSIQIQRSRNERYSSGHRYALTVKVSMTDIAVPIWLQGKFGGSICTYKPKKGYRRPLIRWAIGAKGTLRFLEAIYPYLVAKKNEAELAIEFQHRLMWRFERFGPGHSRSPEIVQSESELWARLRDLHKGVRFDDSGTNPRSKESENPTMARK